MQSGVGSDLGASFIRVATEKDGMLAKEPSLLAVDKNNARILSIGENAKTDAEQNPSAVLMRPFTKGLLFRKNMTRYVLSEILASLPSPMPAALAVPSGYSDVEGEELLHLMNEVGFPSAVLVHSPVAALYGAGYTPDTDCIVVDFGAVQTSISLFLDGRTVYTATYPIGGDTLDRDVADFLLTEYKLRITTSAGELLKTRIGAAWNDGEDLTVRVSGERLSDGSPDVVTLTTTVLMNAFEKTLSLLVEQICGFLRRVPLSKVESMFQNGIFLTGGSAALSGLDRLIGALCGVHTSVLPDGGDAVVSGLSRIASLSFDDPVEAALLSRLLYRNS